MNNIFTVKTALDLIGGLSEPSKMPCHGYSIPASKCITGAKLATVANSICSKCYALKGNYRYPNVQKALMKRFESLTHPKWVEAMIMVILGKEKSGYFRWNDSGDIQSLEHLEKIVVVCNGTRGIKHWLPTREYGFVSEYVAKHGVFPNNLTVRLSAFMIDGPSPIAIATRFGVGTSGVGKDNFTCPASNQGNKCLDCRACWDKNVPNIGYKKH